MKLQQEIQCLNGDLYTIQEELKSIAQKQKRAVLFDDETIADNGSVFIGFPSSDDSAESDVIDSYQNKDVRRYLTFEMGDSSETNVFLFLFCITTGCRYERYGITQQVKKYMMMYLCSLLLPSPSPRLLYSMFLPCTI